MKKRLKFIIRELKRKITVVFIPHGKMKPFKLNFSLSFILILCLCWTVLTLWAGFVSGRHLDYVKMKADNEIMRVRMLFFSDEIKKSKEMLSQIKQNDEQIRSLLAMNSKKVIIEDGLGYGGPTPVESSALSTILSGNLNKFSYQDVINQSLELFEEYKFSLKSYSEVMEHINTQRMKFRYTPSMWPCKGIISSPFGFRIHPILGYRFFHTGLDIANMTGTSIKSTADGTVLLAGWKMGYGKVIVVRHNSYYRTVYAHLSKILVKRGDTVMKGQEIGKMGNTGRSTDPHLHYEVHYCKKPVNPIKYLSSNLD